MNELTMNDVELVSGGEVTLAAVVITAGRIALGFTVIGLVAFAAGAIYYVATE